LVSYLGSSSFKNRRDQNLHLLFSSKLTIFRWDIALELSELGGGISKREVARHEAAALAEERPEEAEAAFLRASAPDDAVRMWLARGQHQRALALAEQHATHMVTKDDLTFVFQNTGLAFKF
jgi:hypothetical protein